MSTTLVSKTATPSTPSADRRIRAAKPWRTGSGSPAELAVAAQAGDSDAAGELYRRLRPRARRAASGFCLELDADDAVAEGLSRALRRIDQLRDPAAVEAWMLRSVVRSAIDLSRRRRRQRTLDVAGELTAGAGGASESAAETVITAMEHDSMAEALGRLEPGMRLLLYLRYEACLSIQHIALTLDRPPGTVRRQCLEARRLAGQQFLGRHLRPAAGACAQVTEVLCRSSQRPPATRVRQRTAEHLRRCRACRDRQHELTDVLAELGCRAPRPDHA